MTKIIYKSHQVETRGKGKNKRLSITALFFDEAHPDKDIIYNHSAIINAIEDRKRRNLETEGLEYGLEKVLEEYKSRGLTPPESHKDKRRRQRDFATLR